jgi:methyl-accepting chemotaxis protein
MRSSWTFGRRVAAGFALSFALLAVIGTVAYRSIGTLETTRVAVEHTHVVLQRIADVLSLLKDAETGQRGFVITGDESFLEPYRSAAVAVDKDVQALRTLTADNPSQQKRIGTAEPLINAKLRELKQTIDTRTADGFAAAAKIVAAGHGKASMDELRGVLGEMEQEERELLTQRSALAEAARNRATTTIVAGSLLSLILITAAGVIITRSLSTRIGAAVQHVQSSSSELQTAANQQVTGAREQSTAMNEITTTINELLATSKQIAESAQRVAHIAEDTAKAARSGELTASKTNESFASIKRQVDLIVTHMLDLSQKSQQIGGILEIINELTEQTNILAINATIEAAGAGDAGKRFAVVADEIRKLADRVGGSTREIRGLIDEVRAAANTTVMTTEGGTKAVDAGLRQFAELTGALRQIGNLVGTTTEAAREIELSTKQQSTAVEQVNSAIADVAQTTRETEASSAQTFQTATLLAALSLDLVRLIRPQPST